MTVTLQSLAYCTLRARRGSRAVRLLARAVAVVAIVVLIVLAIWWYAVLRPHWHLQQLLWEPSASPSELREAAHETLRFYSPAPHDAYLVLLKSGDASSVPFLIRSLRWQPETKPGSRVISCTKQHCLDALRQLTGKDLGSNYDDWSPLLDASPTSSGS